MRSSLTPGTARCRKPNDRTFKLKLRCTQNCVCDEYEPQFTKLTHTLCQQAVWHVWHVGVYRDVWVLSISYVPKNSFWQIWCRRPKQILLSSRLSAGETSAETVRAAESKQARMFVILWTARESGSLILGMLIDSIGKVCLCLLAKSKRKIPLTSSG